MERHQSTPKVSPKIIASEYPRFIFYFRFSVCMILLGILFWLLPLPTNPQRHQDLAQWYGYVRLLVLPLLLPAFYGLLGPDAWRKSKERGESARRFFVGAALYGVVAEFCGYAYNYLGHVDCGDECSSDVLPTFMAMKLLLLAGVLLAVVLPLILGYYRITKQPTS